VRVALLVSGRVLPLAPTRELDTEEGREDVSISAILRRKASSSVRVALLVSGRMRPAGGGRAHNHVCRERPPYLV